MATSSIFANFDLAERLSQLQNACCDRSTFLSIYGLDLWSPASEARGLFQAWARRLPRKPTVILSPDQINRWLFERFLQQEHYLPTRNAAIKFALTETDFIRVVDAMCEKGLLPYSASFAKDMGLFETSLVDNLHHHFPAMKFRFFNSQSAFVTALHGVFRRELGIELTTVYSACSKKLHEEPPEVAYEYDIITGEPMGIGHQVWLDFHKPLVLKPDACSECTFDRYRAELQRWAFQPARAEA